MILLHFELFDAVQWFFLFCDKSPEKVLACFDMIKLLFFLLIFRYNTIVSVLVSTRELFIFARGFNHNRLLGYYIIFSATALS